MAGLQASALMGWLCSENATSPEDGGFMAAEVRGATFFRRFYGGARGGGVGGPLSTPVGMDMDTRVFFLCVYRIFKV